MTVRVDRATVFPVSILLEASTHVEGKSKDWFDFSEFVWNEPVAAEFLSLDTPEGYTEKGTPNAGQQ